MEGSVNVPAEDWAKIVAYFDYLRLGLDPLEQGIVEKQMDLEEAADEVVLRLSVPA